MYILGIETSCDETAIGIIDENIKVYANVIYSQIKEHKIFGGVVPEIASRKHIEKIKILTIEAFKQSGLNIKDIDVISVTQGPGLIGALLVGVNFAKAIAYALKKKLYFVNHIEGHIFSVFIENNISFPFVSLVASGGHTNIFLVEDFCKYTLLGKTLDDAAGEAFDKVAKMLNLGYPGGPIVEKLSKNGDENAIKFPRAFIEKNNFNFSFSGLKTAVRNFILKNKNFNIEDICASFQKAVADVFIFKISETVQNFNVKNISFSGGVACNKYIKDRIYEFCKENNLNFYSPSPIYCTDNGVMIAFAGLKRFEKNPNSQFDLSENAFSKLKL